jgi:hypothetical protein
MSNKEPHHFKSLSFLLFFVFSITLAGCVSPLHISQDFIGIGLYKKNKVLTRGNPQITSARGFGIGFKPYSISIGYQKLTIVRELSESEGIEVFAKEFSLKTGKYADNLILQEEDLNEKTD